MAFAYYMDVHIPAAITHGLRRRRIEVLTSQEDGTISASDESLLRRATEIRRILFTQDQDFLSIAQRWQNANKQFFGLVFAHQRATSIGRCIDDLEIISQCCAEEEIVNRLVFVPL